MKPAHPFLSVIVPAHQGEGVLEDTLGALVASDLDRGCWELIVADDASTDRTALVAARYADRVVRLPGRPHGPAYARNRAAEVASGCVLVFVDADVRVHRSALRKIAEHFAGDERLGAVFGSYDDDPPAAGTVSRFRNLLHHYHHNKGAGPAETFWAGLGAIRRAVFVEQDGFDEWRYERPQIEDIELGMRIRRAGHPIILDPSIQGAHLKRWRFINVVTTDLLHRGIPWMRLLLRAGSSGDTLNVSPTARLSVGTLGLGLVALGAAAVTVDWRALVLALTLFAVVVGLNFDLYCFLQRNGGLVFAAACVPLHFTYFAVSGVAVVVAHLAHRLLKDPGASARNSGLTARPGAIWPPAHRQPRFSIWDIHRSESQ